LDDLKTAGNIDWTDAKADGVEATGKKRQRKKKN
jgi:hypothetical protein